MSTKTIAMSGYSVKISMVTAGTEDYAAVSIHKLTAPWTPQPEPHVALIPLAEGS